jgi:hypothetical protein
MRNGMKPRLVASAMGLLAIFCLLDSRISGAAGLDLKIQNGKVSLHADQVSLISVLKAIAGNEDIYLESSSPLTKPVSLDLTGLSVEESLRRLLAKENYTLIFKKTGETRFVVTEIRILAPGTKDKSAPRIKPKRVARVDTITTAPPPRPLNYSVYYLKFSKLQCLANILTF